MVTLVGSPEFLVSFPGHRGTSHLSSSRFSQVDSSDSLSLPPRQDKNDDPITGPDEKCVYWCAGFESRSYPLVMTNIAMENGQFIDDIPSKTSIYSGFSMAMLNNQMIVSSEIYQWAVW